MNSAFETPTASLDDPFYYLTNFRFVLAWVGERHADLLAADELAFVEQFESLAQASQALLVRMVMRKGELFRLSKLSYAEVGDSAEAMAPLIALGWVDSDPALSVDELFNQLRLAELRQALAADIRAAGLSASSAKTVLYDTLASPLNEPKRLCQWWPEANDPILRLTVMETCDRLRLMFFGNLRQDWAEFVLTELGLQRFESVPFTPQSRAFQSRQEVDTYLALHRLRQRLDNGELPADLFPEVPPPADNRWLATRRARLLLQLGRVAERSGDAALAMTLYSESASSQARVRQLRVLERQGEHPAAFELATQALNSSPNETEHQALARILPRLRRRLKLPAEPSDPEPAHERWDLLLPGPQWVERAVVEALSEPGTPVYYVENALLTGLFGLLCWPAIFAPLPGAFFHPFHNGPADLYRDDFVARRQDTFDACLAHLNDGSYQEVIRATWREKHGLASPFVHWAIVDEPLVELALTCIPPEHLKRCFGRLLGDLKANRAGLPDLIQFMPDAPVGEPRYRMIEVKGPGDRLQDNQRRWLKFFHSHGMPVAVCYVRWVASDEPES
ncbi:VRR-NUC domain-containing protein [Halomonas sp. FeN2]|uniref:VRR-NUC domain-containing protein n=1 Tax=Halomonas sp. FeN2 TaxID=2832500 RepID=UPI000C45E84D|nr:MULTISPECIES: VRR-NUC domain-containing protein [unclassified Halomonas]MBF57857.1 nuclease [Halomonas sp.]UBR48267.1 VRR-NUC domain-containing protein [Halomonas sp. FeN2]|tara:strand:+ start:621 stop:2312 length:1692 start_codon:yes stop_codon:yes gene_type:complete